jgi:hypothetical protein
VGRKRLEPLVEYWGDEYDWRRAEAEINRFEHYLVEIDTVPIHFMRRASPRPNAIPLILTHGWPWTFWYLAKVISATGALAWSRCRSPPGPETVATGATAVS